MTLNSVMTAKLCGSGIYGSRRFTPALTTFFGVGGVRCSDWIWSSAARRRLLVWNTGTARQLKWSEKYQKFSNIAQMNSCLVIDVWKSFSRSIHHTRYMRTKITRNECSSMLQLYGIFTFTIKHILLQRPYQRWRLVVYRYCAKWLT